VEGDLELFRLMRRCGHFIYHRSIMNQSQNRILVLLSRYGSMSQKELMEKMKIQAGSLSEVLGKLEANGFIEKRRSSDDKRNFKLLPTEKGRAQAEHFERQQAEIAESMFEPLDMREKDELKQILSKLLEKWEDSPIINDKCGGGHA
jgi:DNA-binding MarR family transcriptional regulator